MQHEQDEIISPAAIFRALTRLEMKQDQILKGHEKLDEDLDKHDTRITALEKRQTYWGGAIAALVFVFSAGQAAGPLLAGYLADLTGDFTLGYAAAGLIALLTILLIRALRPPQVSG